MANKILKIGINGTDNMESFHNLLNENILQPIKICRDFKLETSIIDKDLSIYCDYNFIFYVTKFDKLSDTESINNIKKIALSLTDPMNHLFIIIDDCNKMKIDDDGDLILCNAEDCIIYEKFDEQLSLSIADNLFHTCKLSIPMINIWKTISKDSSIVNLTDDQIDKLATLLIKKSSKMSIQDKKREIKICLKKINIDDKLAECGYVELSDNITQYFKIVNQKKIVCQNYLYTFNKINIGFNNVDSDGSSCIKHINNFLKEIYEITYLKTEMHDTLTDKVDSILLSKLKNFYDACKNNVVIESNKSGSIDAYLYHKFLIAFMDIAVGYNLSNIMEITKQEISKVNNLIIEHYKKEVERVTDLEKIISVLEIFANKDKNNLIGLFEKIRTHPKIMEENIQKMDKWILFVDKCLRLAIPKDSIIRLIEEIILAKIAFYADHTKIKNGDISIVYPQCLHIFLLSNLNKNFVFKKLLMFVSYSIRYSGRNIADLIKNIKQEQFQNLLVLENKLLQLCMTSFEEPSQPINLSEVDIVETFNAEKVTSKNKKY